MTLTEREVQEFAVTVAALLAGRIDGKQAVSTIAAQTGHIIADRLAAAEATLARVERLTGGPASDGYRPYAVDVGGEVHFAVLLDDIRAALAPTAVARCRYLSPSPWGTTQCALPLGHDECHAYSPSEGFT